MEFPFFRALGALLEVPDLPESPSEASAKPKNDNPLSSIQAFDNYQRSILKQFMQLQAVEAYDAQRTGTNRGAFPMSEAWNRVQHVMAHDANQLAMLQQRQQVLAMRQLQAANRAGAQGGVGNLAQNVEQLVVQ